MAINSTGDGFLTNHSAGYDVAAEKSIEKLNQALEDLQNDPSNPAVLAEYQARVNEYVLYRSAQSNSVKLYKDTCAGIIQNFR